MRVLQRQSRRPVACPKGISIGGDFPARSKVEVPASLVHAEAGVSDIWKNKASTLQSCSAKQCNPKILGCY